MNLVIFTEERSMKEALQPLLAKLGLEKGSFRIISFDGVGNMKTSLPGQLRALFGQNDTRVLILRDNDNGLCNQHKQEIADEIRKANLIGRAKVRIVCQMLEGWFLGDTSALKRSGHMKRPIPKRLQTCDPDSIRNPKSELKRLRDGYNEITGAKAIAPYLDLASNRSASFRHTMQAIRDLTTA